MRPRALAWLIPAGLTTAFAFAACGGTTTTGSGTVDPLNTNEPATSSSDPPSSSVDPPSSGGDPPTSSSDPSGNTTGTNALNAFLGCFDAEVPPACISCVEQGCAGDLRALEGACGAVIDCLGTCSCGDDSCYAACAETYATGGCEQVVTHLQACSPTQCASLCGGSSATINLGGDGGTSTQQPGSGNGTGVTSTGGCSALSTCCGSLPSQEQPGCNSVVSANNTTACNSTLSELNGEGICN